MEVEVSMTNHQPTRPSRILQFLGGQSASISSSGSGRRVLYRCPSCNRIWLQDGPRWQFDLKGHELTQLVQELSANLDILPAATCRLCLFQRATGAVEIDEYGSKDGDGKGFGVNWEAPEPIGAHLLATIVARSWLARQTSLVPDIVTTPKRLRAVLRWLVETTHFPLLTLLAERDSAELARTNPPGFGMAGTETWQWKGAIFQLPCRPLRDEAIVTLAIALPRTEPLDLQNLVMLWQSLAELILLGHVGGEDQ
jgi:hypothetical protein